MHTRANKGNYQDEVTPNRVRETKSHLGAAELGEDQEGGRVANEATNGRRSVLSLLFSSFSAHVGMLVGSFFFLFVFLSPWPSIMSSVPLSCTLAVPPPARPISSVLVARNTRYNHHHR